MSGMVFFHKQCSLTFLCHSMYTSVEKNEFYSTICYININIQFNSWLNSDVYNELF